MYMYLGNIHIHVICTQSVTIFGRGLNFAQMELLITRHHHYLIVVGVVTLVLGGVDASSEQRSLPVVHFILRLGNQLKVLFVLVDISTTRTSK